MSRRSRMWATQICYAKTEITACRSCVRNHRPQGISRLRSNYCCDFYISSVRGLTAAINDLDILVEWKPGMNHYPDNYHGYGRDTSGMQNMAFSGYRESSAMPIRGQPHPDYHGGGYPMLPQHGGGGSRNMYGQSGVSPYGMTNYGHYNTSSHMHHQGGMVNPYYNSHGQVPGPTEGHHGYNIHHQHHMGMMSPGHQRHPSVAGSRGGGQHGSTASAGQDHYGGAYPGQSSPSRMPLQHPPHSSHPQVPVPPHPMRQTNTQQNPQEVADNILQMASAYPSNQTVQVPLKNRPAPYHIPRSPHFVPRSDHPHHSSPSPHHHQQSYTSHASPSPTSGAQSPISHNAASSPSVGMVRSPSGQVMSPSQPGSAYHGQAMPQAAQLANMASSHSTISGGGQSLHYHNQHPHAHPPQQGHLVQHSDSPHYSPCSLSQSPYSASPSAPVQSSPYSPHNPASSHHHPATAGNMMSSSCANNMSVPYVSSPSGKGQPSSLGQNSAEASNNPLMSLEKLVMLPETQVVDPKSVVNDACLAQSEEGPKNGEDPAEWPAESSGHSVGCSGFTSSPIAQSVGTGPDGQPAAPRSVCPTDTQAHQAGVDQTTSQNGQLCTGSQSSQVVNDKSTSQRGRHSMFVQSDQFGVDQSTSQSGQPCTGSQSSQVANDQSTSQSTQHSMVVQSDQFGVDQSTSQSGQPCTGSQSSQVANDQSTSQSAQYSMVAQSDQFGGDQSTSQNGHCHMVSQSTQVVNDRSTPQNGQHNMDAQSYKIITTSSNNCPENARIPAPDLNLDQSSAITSGLPDTNSGHPCIDLQSQSQCTSKSQQKETASPSSDEVRDVHPCSKSGEISSGAVDKYGHAVSAVSVERSGKAEPSTTGSGQDNIKQESDSSISQTNSRSHTPTATSIPDALDGHSPISEMASAESTSDTSDGLNSNTSISSYCTAKLEDETGTANCKGQSQDVADMQIDVDSKSNVTVCTSNLEVAQNPEECVKSIDKKDGGSIGLLNCPVSLLSSTITGSDCKNVKQETEIESKADASSQVALCKSSLTKEDVKFSPLPCHPPTVLSEVPIITNNVDGATVCAPDDDKDLDYDTSIHTKVHNGLSALVKSKVSYSRRAALITPCSIAVEASERAACERFGSRHTAIGRVTRNSSFRDRSNSTGNADSDESSENISSSSYLLSKDPQDGNRKRGPSSSTKRNGFNKSVGLVISSSTRNTDGNSSKAKASLGKTGCGSNGTTAGSDEEGCYYEGVDNSYDVYLNSFSSDDSGHSGDDKDRSGQPKEAPLVRSSTDGRKTTDDSAAASSPVTKKEKDIESGTEEKRSQDLSPELNIDNTTNSLSPPPKKLKVSPNSSINRSCPNRTPPQNSAVVIDLTSESSSPVLSPGRQRMRSIDKFRPSILGRKTPMKYPVVVLDKSTAISPKITSVNKESSDLKSMAVKSSPPRPVTDVKPVSIPCSELASSDVVVSTPCEAASVAGAVQSVTVIKEEGSASQMTSISVSPKKNIQKKSPKKKKASKSKAKGKEVRSDEGSNVKDSFKSMKFSRTLDLMKANRKREGVGIGPFVRLVGSRSFPKTVSVFAQPTADTLAAAKHGKMGQTGRKSQSNLATVTTVHMVSNFPSKQEPMVPSTRPFSQKPWVCAFCGQHSSYRLLGDLFGPYFKESEVTQAEKLALEESKKADVDKDVKHQDLGKKSVTKGQPASSSSGSSRQHRRKSALQPRMNEETKSQPEELWIHQACALWSPGVCLVGNKLYGLEEAVKDAAESVCSVCKCVGAVLGCLHRGCTMKYHIVCAAEKDCYLDEENFTLLCPKHKEKKFGAASTSKS
ncbi:transcription factor 20 [Plakobranchus ocellatus]|uniref:Transcription factor 20 n=1 Tax=Plakobranchus ocellatus TaxID=259542 RepID=A0AAV4CN19_9GAST|nr:transcription factor 20 [Plakobranchus ocellatus]